jgi:hypothetical protein
LPLISPEPSNVPTQTVAIIGHNRRSNGARRGPETICHTFVKAEGMSSSAAASAGTMTVPSPPIATVGSPRPMTPFTPPAIKNVPNIRGRWWRNSLITAVMCSRRAAPTMRNFKI